MKPRSAWLKTHAFAAHSLAFGLMAVPSILLFLAARQGAAGWTYGLLGLVILGNLLELSIR